MLHSRVHAYPRTDCGIIANIDRNPDKVEEQNTGRLEQAIYEFLRIDIRENWGY